MRYKGQRSVSGCYELAMSYKGPVRLTADIQKDYIVMLH